jgi:hypothetical protein
MRRANFFLAGIVALQFGFAAEAEYEFWHYVPDGDVPEWLRFLGYCYCPAVVGLLYLWCRADAQGRRVRISVITSVLVPLLFPVSIPYYYLRTYPARSAFLHIGLAGAFIALCVAAFWLGHTLAFDYYAIWTNHPRTRY